MFIFLMKIQIFLSESDKSQQILKFWYKECKEDLLWKRITIASLIWQIELIQKIVIEIVTIIINFLEQGLLKVMASPTNCGHHVHLPENGYEWTCSNIKLTCGHHDDHSAVLFISEILLWSHSYHKSHVRWATIPYATRKIFHRRDRNNAASRT